MLQRKSKYRKRTKLTIMVQKQDKDAAYGKNDDINASNEIYHLDQHHLIFLAFLTL